MLILQIVLSMTFLSIASVYDLKKREVPNRVWEIFIPLSIINTAVNLLNNPSLLNITVISIAITVLIAFAIFYLGLYGGADAKALINLAIAHPAQSSPVLALPLLPLSVFNNSLILMALSIPAALARNLYWAKKNRRPLFKGLEKEPSWKKALALFLCLKKARSEIKRYHIPAEVFEEREGEKVRTLKIFQRIPEEDTIIDATTPEDTFVAYSLPMLPFLTLGYFIAITMGDLIFHLITIMLS